MDPVLDVCVREPVMDPVLDVCVREPVMDPVLDVYVREPIMDPSFTRVCHIGPRKLSKLGVYVDYIGLYDMGLCGMSKKKRQQPSFDY